MEAGLLPPFLSPFRASSGLSFGSEVISPSPPGAAVNHPPSPTLRIAPPAGLSLEPGAGTPEAQAGLAPRPAAAVGSEGLLRGGGWG